MIGIIIQARSRSTRFPNKIMADLCGKPVIERVIQRCKASMLAEAVIVAMPQFDEAEEKVRKIAAKYGVDVYAPDAEHDDVLARFFKTATEYHLDIIVRITADCPLIDPQIIDRCLEHFYVNRNSTEYTTNTLRRVHPRGMDVEVFSYGALKASFQQATEETPKLTEYDQEHVTTFIRRYPKRFIHTDLAVHPALEGSDLRLTLDHPEDLELLKTVHESCKGMPHFHNAVKAWGKGEEVTGQYPMYGLQEILTKYKEHPTWKNINGRIKQVG